MTIDQQCAAATTRLNLWIARSAGQHSRHVRASFAQIMPVAPELVSRTYPAWDVIAFAGPEPEEHADGLAMFGRVVGALIGLVLFAALAGYFYIKLKGV